MKILSWNLNHRTLMKKIPDAVLSIINKIYPDVVVLNEYVDGKERAIFKESLKEIGFTHISLSRKLDRQNQILIASRAEHIIGDLEPPSYDDSAITNFLHILLPIFDIEIVGIRVPAYKKTQEVRSYWSELLSIIGSTISHKIIFIGDFNCNPDVSKTPGAKALNLLKEAGWKIPLPSGNWSYISHDGRISSRLDYAIGSPEVDKITGRYISKLDSNVIAGPRNQEPISDHAILIVDISPINKIKVGV